MKTMTASVPVTTTAAAGRARMQDWWFVDGNCLRTGSKTALSIRRFPSKMYSDSSVAVSMVEAKRNTNSFKLGLRPRGLQVTGGVPESGLPSNPVEHEAISFHQDMSLVASVIRYPLPLHFH